MPTIRTSYPPSLKAKVAVEAIKGHKTTAQIAQMFGVHPTQVKGWKKQALAGLPDVFGNGREQMRQQSELEKDELACSLEDQHQWIDPQHPSLSIQWQCELLGVPRSTYYHQLQPERTENLGLLRANFSPTPAPRPIVVDAGKTVDDNDRKTVQADFQSFGGITANPDWLASRIPA